MFNTCKKCETKRINFNFETLGNEDIEWQEWKSITETRNFKVGKIDQEKDVSFMRKENIKGTIDELVDKFEKQIDRFKHHLYIFRSQYKYLRTRKLNLKQNECLIHVDFSENYEGKMASEVQGMNFGASKRQISLHTGVYYTSKTNYQTFCTVSDNLHHGPGGIWAHLKPVLEDIKKRYPHKSSIEFFSDGPSSQYRQRFNFFMFSSEIYRLGFSKAEWNFFEAGHGKGVPDAVGGAIKRKADQKVKFGSTIMSAKSFVKCLKKSQTQLFEIPDTEIETARQELKKVDIKPIPGTLKLHQLKTFSQGNLLYREISCECIEPNTCNGHEMKIHKFQTANNNPPSKAEKPKKHRKNKDSNTKTQSEQMTKTDNKMKMKSKQMKQTAKTKSTKEHEQMKMTDKNKATDSVETNQSACKKATEYEQMKQSGNLEAKERNMNSNNVKINPEQNYPLLLNKLRNCRGFEQLKVKCNEISQSFSELPTVPQSVTVLSSNLEVDTDAMDLYPNDVPDSRVLFPCIVPADGNCLPSSGSVFGYGCPDFSAEIRLRILCELALNEDTYLNNDFLLKGLPDNEKSRNLAKSYAMYSDMWVPGMLLNDDMIKSIYQMELRKIRVNYSFMGMWQIHALSSVLKVPIYSIYPHRSSPEIRRDLNRLVLPRQSSSNMTPVYIFWTTTRDSEMVCEHWAPNHFVPCVPIDENSVYSPRTINISEHQNDLPSRVEFVDLTTEDSSQFTEKHKITEIYMRLKGVNTMAEDSKTDNKVTDINNNVTEYHTCREDHKVDTMIETDESMMETGTTKVDRENGEMETENRRMGTDYSKAEAENSKMETRIKKTDYSKVNKRAKTIEVEVERIAREMEAGKIKMTTEYSKVETHDSKKETHDSMAMTVDSKMEAWNEKKTDYSKMTKGADNMKMDTEYIKVKTEYNKMETESNKMEKKDSKMETGGSKMETGDSKMETEDSKMETGDSKMETGGSKMETGDSKMETEDSKMETESNKMEKEDSKMETGGSKMETGDSKMETGDSKMETGDSKMETGDSEMETGENKMATEFSKMETGDSKMEKGVSKTETDNSMRKTDNSKIEEHDKKTDCSKGDKGDKKMKAGHRKMDIEFIKVKTDNSKMETEESKMETEYEKMKREESKLGKGDIEIGIDDSLKTNDIAQDVLTKYIKKVTANDHLETPVPLPLDCIGKHVIVKYGRQAYPGIVEDAGEYDVFVKCMHGIGRKNSNCLYWPKKIIDRCWYDHENILALIPEPTKMEGTNSHFKVEEKTWNFITNKLNEK